MFTMKLIVVCLLWLNLVQAAGLMKVNDDKNSSFSTENILSQRGQFIPPPVLYDLKELNRVLFSDIQTQNADLKKVKFNLVNGETNLAQAQLAKLAFTQTKLKPIIYRYLGMLKFIDGDFQKSLDYLSIKELQGIPNYQKICTLKVLNLVVLNEKRKLDPEWERCKLENYNHFRESSFVWVDILVKMKLKPTEGLTKEPFKGIKLISMSTEELKIFLKLSIYLNQESLLKDQMSELDVGQVEDPEVRDLIGQIYFRLGMFAKSYKFIDGLDSPNSENIKGNLYILRNKYELAYAQFKLALVKKQNSQNAMERILPLAWLLGDWEEGGKISERVMASPQTQINKMTLISAFYAQAGDYKKAQKYLNLINEKSRRGNEIDVTQIYSFVGLMENQPKIIKKNSAISCSQYDLVSCWVAMQMEQWDAFPLTIRRPDRIPDKKNWQKLSQARLNEPLAETVYVNQLDIEELDDKLIELIPGKK